MSASSSIGVELSPPQQAATLRKVMLRVIPIVFVGYIMSYLDRVNLGFAQIGTFLAGFGRDAASIAPFCELRCTANARRARARRAA